jgi:hypothetical protein
VNRSEEFVYDICRRSFLSLWSCASPQGKGGKELCDVLIVCDPDVIVVSVKEVGLGDSGDISTDWERWSRRAIDDSAKQIYGAERWLKSANRVVKSDGTDGLPLPDLQKRRLHRVAVALGSRGRAPIKYGDLGKGFVHVFDESSFYSVLRELDTISDFVEYLTAKEAYSSSGKKIVFEGTEEDLLAIYLHAGRKFPQEYDLVVVGDDLWRALREKPEYQAKNAADHDSYFWDRMIEVFSRGEPEIGPSLSEAEIAIRVMAREGRFARRLLGSSFKEFFEDRTIRSRAFVSPSGVVYVFLAVPHGTDGEFLQAELGNRCFVARGLNQQSLTVVGIGTEYFEGDDSSALFMCYLHKEDWSLEDDANVKAMQSELGYFVKPRLTSRHEDEYPTSRDSRGRRTSP